MYSVIVVGQKPQQQQQQQIMGNINQHAAANTVPHQMNHVPPAIPISLAQHLTQNLPNQMQRMRPLNVRPILPMTRIQTTGINSQQQQVNVNDTLSETLL